MSAPTDQSVPETHVDGRDATAQHQRMLFAGEEEEFGDEELGDDVDLGVGQYGRDFGSSGGDEYVISDPLHQNAPHQSQVQAQQVAAALAAVPEPVRKYFTLFHQAIVNSSVVDISNAYESHWNRLTEKFYQRAEWPDSEVISPLVGDGACRMAMELTSRPKVPASVSRALVPAYSDGPVPLELPVQWLWDITDEFIYQFQSYSQWRNKVTNKNEAELQLLQDGGVWSSYSVLNVLYSLIQKSKVTEQLIASNEGCDPEKVVGEFGSRPLYKMLGYFSIIGLLRVHVLLGDYTLALKMLDHINLHKKNGFLNRVTACHVTTYYYVGFAYMMLRRYPDAIRAFSHILVFVMRLRQYHTRSYQYDLINKMADRMYALLAICCALCPTRLDENVQLAMREKYGEQYSKMTKAGDDALVAYQELFLFACPKFITANGPPYHDAAALKEYMKAPHVDPVQHQLRTFLSDVKTQLSNVHTRSFLRLYTSLGTDKLAGFLEVSEEEVVEMMMVLKNSTRSLKWTHGGLLEGELINTSDLGFAIDTDMVDIAESRIGRRYGDWFVRNATRMNNVLLATQRKPLPVAQRNQPPVGAV
ncbi:hypothetical protein MSPP1_001005 [Malassezia sp. CBS 17886]|nr:hypothetical protein MSPP1_001005 [Malassezia sp. CBS 17886]